MITNSARAFAVAALVLSALVVFAACTSPNVDDSVTRFDNIAEKAFGDLSLIDNRYPGVAIFDYDGDGDHDLYVTQAETGALFAETAGGPNRLFRNDGDNRFTEVAATAGVDAPEHNSTGVAACDFNNDGFKDLYVAAYGRIGDGLDYRSIEFGDGLEAVVTDRLFMNNRNGTFRDATQSAFGSAANVRSALSVACSDVDGDGLLDIFVANRADQDYIRFDIPWHHGHYNAFYFNQGDGTFTEMSTEAGLRTDAIFIRDAIGDPITFYDPLTDTEIEGYDVSKKDAAGNLIGEPTGQSLAAMFFDYDDDGDQDLWVADDGDTLKVFRNDSTPGRPRFTSVGQKIGINKVGAWMGFAVGDIDSDMDLDVFVTNIAYHPLTRGLPQSPGGDCAYAHQFDWGTCFHYLLRNDGMVTLDGGEQVAMFVDIAGEIDVTPNAYLPSQALDDTVIQNVWEKRPTGLQQYDFGFGTAFVDINNDGNQDLYWLGAMAGRGEGPNGMLWPGTGRMLSGDGQGNFADVTVESRLLDAANVNYEDLESGMNEAEELAALRIGYQFHENGKGLAKGDINGDGRVDLVGTNSRGFICDETGRPVNAPVPLCPHTNGLVDVTGGPLFVWINQGMEGNFLTLRLRGTVSNADAIGARAYVTPMVDGAPQTTQIQEIVGGSSFLSSNATDLVFGLGEATVAEVEIRWPTGITQSLGSIYANMSVTLEEPRS